MGARSAALRWGIAAAVFAAAAAALLPYLLSTDVPGDLHLSHVDVRDYFNAAQLEKARDYERFLAINFVLSQIALIVVLIIYAARGERFARESAAGRIGTGMLLGMIGLAFVWLAQLPFGFADLWWERRHGVSKLGYLEFAFGNWALLGGEFLFACFVIAIVMGLAGPLRDRWWIVGVPALLGVGLLFTFVTPFLVGDSRSLRDVRLQQEAKRIARAEGLPKVPVRVEEVHEYTTEPNAAATGLGPSRRVYLWDTLLDGRFKRNEIEVVLAHEFGHLSRNHIWKLFLWSVLFAIPVAFAVTEAARWRGGIQEARAVPLALLVVAVLQIVVAPVQNVATRRIEAEADWVALETTRDPSAARALFRHFGLTTLSQPSPPTWRYLLSETHPTIEQRIAMANAWQARQSRAGGSASRPRAWSSSSCFERDGRRCLRSARERK
jgi:STE24 endopeptidase